jgi:mono/diheme cytochrome c family protein
MKKQISNCTKLSFISVSIFLVLLVFLAGAKINSFTPTRQVSAANPTDAASNFAKHCAKCHGRDGKGDTPKGRQTEAPDLTASRVSDSKGIRTITNGRGSMPSFKKSLSAEEISALMAYVRGFRK